MTNKYIKFVFVFLFTVFGVSLFAGNCEAQKDVCTNYLNECAWNLQTLNSDCSDLIQFSEDSYVDITARSMQGTINTCLLYVGRLQSAVLAIDCGSNDTCSVDLGPLVEICSNIYNVSLFELSSLSVITNDFRLLNGFVQNIHDSFTLYFSYDDPCSVFGDQNFSPDYFINVRDNYVLGAVSNNNAILSYNFGVISNYLYNIDSNLFSFYSEFSSLIWEFFYSLNDIDAIVNSLFTVVQNYYTQVLSYLPYLKTISDDLKLISTNGTYNIDQSYTNQLYSSSLLGFDRFRYYAQGQLNNTQPSLYPLSPYDSLQHLRNATIYDAVSSGFTSLLISQGSINNYLYWLKAIAGSNRLDGVESHLVAVSNLVGRLDDYVLGDFSNEVSRLVETLSYVTNRVDYTTNFVHLAELVETNNVFLSSIDSKLDVLDYIKILSDTPLSDYSGDGDYFGYLTNLYLNGSSDSGFSSTNWFERIEILLASLVFGDSGVSSISNEVEFTDFSEETIENAFNDYTFQNELTSGISLVEDTGENFLTILRGFHNSLSSISQPQSIAIGIGGLDGQDTLTYQDVMHHHFQVSFNSGASDNFTLIVRSMTTIIWILVTMMFVYFSARWLLSKVLFFYRLMRTLITSLFLK